MNKILIIDNTKIIQNLIKSVISTSEFPSVLLLADSIESIEIQLQKNDDINIIFLNWHKDQYTIFDIINLIRVQYKEKLVILISPNIDDQYKIKETLNIVDDFILKPVDEFTFLNKINKILSLI